MWIITRPPFFYLMQYLIQFFRYICDGLIKVLGFVTTLPGQIATLFASISGSIWALFDFVSSSSDSIASHCQIIDNHISAFSSAPFFQNDYFRLINYCLSLDSLWSNFVAIFTFFISCVSLLALTIFPFLLTFGFSVWVINISRNLVNSYLPNAAKV